MIRGAPKIGASLEVLLASADAGNIEFDVPIKVLVVQVGTIGLETRTLENWTAI